MSHVNCHWSFLLGKSLTHSIVWWLCCTVFSSPRTSPRGMCKSMMMRFCDLGQYPFSIPLQGTTIPFCLPGITSSRNCTFESNWTSGLLVVNVNGLCEGLGYLCQSNQLPPSLVHDLAEPCCAQILHVPFVITDLQTIIHQIALTDPTKPFLIEPHLLGLSQSNYYRS